MVCKLLSALALLLVLLLPTPASAAWAVVSGQVHTISTVNDGVIDLPNTAGVGNVVIIVTAQENFTDTVSITGTSNTFTTTGPLDSGTYTIRIHISCAVITEADDTFTVTTSGSGTASSHGIEFTGGTCDLAAGSSQISDAATPYPLVTPINTSPYTGALVVTVIRSTTAANFDPPSGGYVQFGTDALPTAGAYLITTDPDDFTAAWTSAANEQAFNVALAYQESGAAAATPCAIGAGLIAPGCPGELK